MEGQAGGGVSREMRGTEGQGGCERYEWFDFLRSFGGLGDLGALHRGL